MADDFSDEEWQRIDEGLAKGSFSPKQMELLTRLRQQRAQPPAPAGAPAATPGAGIERIPMPPPDLIDQLQRQQQGQRPDPAAVPAARPKVTPPPPDTRPRASWGYEYGDPMDPTSAMERAKERLSAPDTATLEQEYAQGQREGMRGAIEWLPTIVAAIAAPQAATSTAYPKLIALYNQVGAPLIRAAHTYLGQYAAELVANIVDPAHYTDPATAAKGEAVGELGGTIFGRVLNTAGRGLNTVRQRVFGETPQGTVRREVIEGLGEKPTMGMASDRYWPQSGDVILSHQPFTGRVRGKYESVHKTLQEELEQHSSMHPGSRVTERSQPLIAEVEAASTPAILHSGPRVLRETREQVIEDVNKRMDQVYDALDTDYLTRPLDWSGAKQAMPQLTAVTDLMTDPSLATTLGVGPDSLFGKTVRVQQALQGLPDTISLASAYDLLKTVRSLTAEAYEHIHEVDARVVAATPLSEDIRTKVVPALGKIEDQLNKVVRPYLVDITSAKAKAQKLVDDWDQAHPGQLQMTQASLQGGQPARAAVMEDPHIQAARGLLKQPDFVKFTDAHQVRSKLLQVARQEGPLVDNTIAQNGQAMADLVDNAMTITGQRLSPDLVPHWRDANRIYSEAKQVFDSTLMHEFKDMSLDDILNKLIKTERPNDMAMLREVLGKNPAGNDVFDTAAQMWLTRQIEHAKTLGGPAGMDTAHLLKTFKQIDPDSERILFPRGELTRYKDKLQRVQYMEQAVDEATKGGKVDELKLYNLKRTLSGAEWESVQSDVLAHMFTGGDAPISGKKLAEGLDKLHHARGVLFDPAHLQELSNLAHTAQYVEKAASNTNMHWNPLIRFSEHTLAAGGLGYLVLHNPLGAAAVAAGWAVSAEGLAYLLTKPSIVKLLTQGLTTPRSAEHGSEIIGMILAQLNNGGYQEHVKPLPAEGEQPAPAVAGAR